MSLGQKVSRRANVSHAQFCLNCGCNKTTQQQHKVNATKNFQTLKKLKSSFLSKKWLFLLLEI